MKGAPTVASISTGGDVKSASGNVQGVYFSSSKGRSPVVSDCFVSTGTGFKSSPSSRGGALGCKVEPGMTHFAEVERFVSLSFLSDCWTHMESSL